MKKAFGLIVLTVALQSFANTGGGDTGSNEVADQAASDTSCVMLAKAENLFETVAMVGRAKGFRVYAYNAELAAAVPGHYLIEVSASYSWYYRNLLQQGSNSSASMKLTKESSLNGVPVSDLVISADNRIGGRNMSKATERLLKANLPKCKAIR